MKPSLRVVALFAAAPLPSLASAETLAPTDAQSEAILAGNSEASVDAAPVGHPGDPTGRKVHGEMGVAIGSHGLRGVYGTAAIPLGAEAGAVVSVESSRYGRAR